MEEQIIYYLNHDLQWLRKVGKTSESDFHTTRAKNAPMTRGQCHVGHVSHIVEIEDKTPIFSQQKN